MEDFDAGAALLQKMLETPQDDAIRGIIADWLRDHGYDLLADVFRAALNEKAHQLRLARIAAAAQVNHGHLVSTDTDGDAIADTNSLTHYSFRILWREFHEELGLNPK